MTTRIFFARYLKTPARRLAPALAALAAALLLAKGCAVEPPLAIAVLGDMEKPNGNERASDSPRFLQNGTVTLHGAGNEVVAFQLLFHAGQKQAGLDVRVGDLAGPAALSARGHVELFLAHYLTSRDASYSWGPGGAGALPWRDFLRRGIPWPDPLVPFADPYDQEDAGRPPLPRAANVAPGRSDLPLRVAGPFAIDPAEHRNQAVWVDLFIPPNQKPGVYKGTVEITQNSKPLRTIPLSLTVHPFNLPAENHVDAFGELYQDAGLMFDTGVRFKDDPKRDWTVSRRYLQMAHAHRFLAAHRANSGPLPRLPDNALMEAPQYLIRTKYYKADWSTFTPYVKPVLSGELFTADEGYAGPSPGAGPSFYPAPFVEAIYGTNDMRAHLAANGGGIAAKWLDAYKENAAAFWEEVEKQGWEKVRFFAYILDEVDGEQDTGENRGAGGSDEATAFHRAMRQIQEALDAGTGGKRRIQLLWTSHADAARWAGTKADLAGTISWWVPNGDALNVKFFQERARRGETVWFYHSGQPAIGNHTINQTGIDLRLWGLLCARYGVQGSFWWSMMDFSEPWNAAEFNPYDYPSYKTEDSRWGNGSLFYPGSRLTMIGAARNIAGPIPSLRMKAYRRGLQDVEYVWLAKQRGQGARADELLKKLIPAAFSEAPKPGPDGKPVKGAWSANPDDYYQLREKLARMIEEKK